MQNSRDSVIVVWSGLFFGVGSFQFFLFKKIEDLTKLSSDNENIFLIIDHSALFDL